MRSLSAPEGTGCTEGPWLAGLLWLLEEGGLGSLELGLRLRSTKDTTATSERVSSLLTAGAREETTSASTATSPERAGGLGTTEGGGTWLLARES